MSTEVLIAALRADIEPARVRSGQTETRLYRRDAARPDGAIVVSTSKMNRILSVDALNRQAWVQPGVLNLDLSKQMAHLGVHFAPDPSSQQTCSIDGNVANNSGGPHCLADGVTRSGT